MKKILNVALFLLLASTGALAAPAGTAARPGPFVLLISVDGL
jgi:hypothetical protein